MPLDFVDAFFPFFVDGKFDDSGVVPRRANCRAKATDVRAVGRAHADAFAAFANLGGEIEMNSNPARALAMSSSIRFFDSDWCGGSIYGRVWRNKCNKDGFTRCDLS